MERHAAPDALASTCAADPAQSFGYDVAWLGGVAVTLLKQTGLVAFLSAKG